MRPLRQQYHCGDGTAFQLGHQNAAIPREIPAYDLFEKGFRLREQTVFPHPQMRVKLEEDLHAARIVVAMHLDTGVHGSLCASAHGRMERGGGLFECRRQDDLLMNPDLADPFRGMSGKLARADLPRDVTGAQRAFNLGPHGSEGLAHVSESERDSPAAAEILDLRIRKATGDCLAVQHHGDACWKAIRRLNELVPANGLEERRIRAAKISLPALIRYRNVLDVA